MNKETPSHTIICLPLRNKRKKNMIAAHATKLVVVFILATGPSVNAGEVSQRFNRVTSSNSSDVCAVDLPSEVFQANPTLFNSVCVPPSVQCAGRCTLDPNCTSFNYKSNLQQCQLYFYQPKTFTSDDTLCQYFSVCYLHCFIFYLLN